MQTSYYDTIDFLEEIPHLHYGLNAVSDLEMGGSHDPPWIITMMEYGGLLRLTSELVRRLSETLLMATSRKPIDMSRSASHGYRPEAGRHVTKLITRRTNGLTGREDNDTTDTSHHRIEYTQDGARTSLRCARSSTLYPS